MNESVMITQIYYPIIEFSKLVYAAFPIMLIILGLSFIVSSVRSEPWGNSIYGLGITSGIVCILTGILLMVIL